MRITAPRLFVPWRMSEVSVIPSETTDSTGGPAFPEAIAISPSGDVHPGYGGMTLRDYFAGQALAGHLASLNPTAEHDPDSAAAFAQSSYQIADAMLAERCK